jgi:hypothetical protein
LRRPIPGATLALGALLLAGCAGYGVEIRNVSAPTVRVVVNGEDLGMMLCGALPITMSSSLVGPGLPWQVDLFRVDGKLWHSITLDGVAGRSQILAMFNEGVLLFPPTEPAVWDAFGRRPCPDPEPI